MPTQPFERIGKPISWNAVAAEGARAVMIEQR
jgi:hypothetical protein